MRVAALGERMGLTIVWLYAGGGVGVEGGFPGWGHHCPSGPSVELESSTEPLLFQQRLMQREIRVMTYMKNVTMRMKKVIFSLQNRRL